MTKEPTPPQTSGGGGEGDGDGSPLAASATRDMSSWHHVLYGSVGAAGGGTGLRPPVSMTGTRVSLNLEPDHSSLWTWGCPMAYDERESARDGVRCGERGGPAWLSPRPLPPLGRTKGRASGSLSGRR